MQIDLRHFIKQLESSEMLLSIEKEADPNFEIPALMGKAEKAGKALLLKKVKKPGYQLVNNILGTRKMLALAFNTTPERVINQWMERVKNPVEPEVVSLGPVNETIMTGEKVDLNELPIVTHCDRDNGPYITAGVVITKDPETGVRNVSINRMQYKSKNRLGIRMMPPQHLGIIYEKCEKKGKNLEVAVAIGNHPFELMSATTTTEYGLDEFRIAGALRGSPLILAKCQTVDLEVPATAEIVLEGEILAGVREDEGPFGDFMQYYVPVMKNHVFQVKAITHRKNPVYQTIQASSMEDTYLLGLSREAVIYDAVSRVADVRAVSLVPTIMNCAIAIKKRFEGEPKNVAVAAFGAYSWLKYCVVVDHDVDVFNMNDVWWAMATRSRPDKGLLPINEAMGFPRDPFHIHQSKLGIDATAPLDQWGEFERKSVPGIHTIRLEDYL